MKRVERVRAALRGERVDKTPFTFWVSPPRNGGDRVRELLLFWDRYRMDLLKVPAGTSERDLKQIRAFLPTDDPPFLLATVTGVWAAWEQEATKARREQIAEQQREQAQRAYASGYDAVFVVVKASPSAEEWLAWEKSVLISAGGRENGFLHLHGNVENDDVLVAEAAAVSCHGARTDARCWMGGWDETRIVGYTDAQVVAETKGRQDRTGHILAPGCTLPRETPPRVLEALCRAARGETESESTEQIT